jgi:EAL domain-containing protein (putative c-di-GMP-specific phosphodiesterase class I)
VAEESGSVEQIDWQMFEKTCVRSGRCPRIPATSRSTCRRRHFRSPLLAGSMLHLFDSYDLAHESCPPARGHGRRAARQSRSGASHAGALRDAAVVAALDDFGTGYSSLSYLHRFPLHSLKIDRSFVSAFAAGRTRRQHGSWCVRCWRWRAPLGMDVIAEGVETDEQRDCLLEIGCELGAGLPVLPCPAASEWAQTRLSH